MVTTGAELEEKILRPLPEYSNDSVTSMASMCRVGSSADEVVPTTLAAAVEAGLAGGAGLFSEAAGAGAAGSGVAGVPV